MNRFIKLFLRASFIVIVVAASFAWSRGNADTLSGSESQQSNDTLRTVQVTGVAESQVKPDMVVVRLGVQTEAKTAQSALNRNSTSVQALINRLRQADIAAADIQTQAISLSPRYDSNSTNTDSMLVGYTAYNVVEVRTQDLEALGGLLDQAVESGANIIENIHFEVSNSEGATDQLREVAVENARVKAEQLARLADATLGPIVAIQESSTFPTPIPLQPEALPTSGIVPVSPGTQTVSVQVQMTWSLVVDSDQ